MSKRGEVAIEVRGLRSHAPGLPPLEAIDCDVLSGGIAALIGPPGAGGGEVLRVLAGLRPVERGTIRLPDGLGAIASPGEARVAGIARIPAGGGLFLDWSVADNLAVGTPWRPRAASAFLEAVGASDLDPNRMARALTPAGRLRVALARALATRPRTLLLDDPTAGLAIEEIGGLFEALARPVAAGLAVLIAARDRDGWPEGASSAVFLNDGKVVAGPPADPASGSARRPRPPGFVPVCEVAELAAGSGLVAASFAVEPGEIVGIYGRCPEERADLVAALGGTQAIRAGTIHASGRELPSNRPVARLNVGLGAIPSGRTALLGESGTIANVSLAALRQFSANRLHLLERAYLGTSAASLARRLGVRATSPRRTPAGTLAPGMQQRILIGRWLLAGARVLVIDELTGDASEADRKAIRASIVEAADEGTAAVLLGADLGELAAVCDRIAPLVAGRLGAFMPRGERGFDLEAIRAASWPQPRGWFRS